MERKRVITVASLLGTLVISKSGFCVTPIQKQGLNVNQKKIITPRVEKTKKEVLQVPLPDLYIENIEVSGSYAINVIIKNKGRRGLTQNEINRCVVSYTPPGGVRNSILLRLIPGANNLSSPNGEVKWEIRNVHKEGQYTAEVDVGNKVPELDESNNIFSKYIRGLKKFHITFSPSGSIHYKGERININWDYEGANSKQFNIKLLKGGHFVRNIATGIRGNNCDWTIPEDLQPGDYIIRVGLGNDPSVYSLQGITIKDIFEEYNFRVLSPNSSSRFKPGDTMVIRWQIDPNKYPRISQITLVKVDSPGHIHHVDYVARYLNIEGTNGSYTYTIPNNIEPGNYILSFNLDRLKDNARSVYDTYLVFVDSQEFIIEGE